MKERIFGFLVMAIIISCTTPPREQGTFALLPLPQELKIKGISHLKADNIDTYFSEGNVKMPVTNNTLKDLKKAENKPTASLVFKIDSSLSVGEQGYTLNVSDNQIQIVGKDKAGLFYAFKTLEQLMEDAEEQNVHLPQCYIKDYPLILFRPVHIDLKHHLNKTPYYYDLIDRLARYKVNALFIEVEDKLGFKRQPTIASADALSIEEWKKISDYALERNIPISPLVQGLGHASFILKHEEYKELRDDPESDWAFNPLNPKTYEVQFDQYLDAMEAFPHGKYLHVGGDEVHTTGRNSGKSELELQLIWLNKVCEFAEKHGRIPIAWDDMPLRHADVHRLVYRTELTQKEVDSVWSIEEPILNALLDKFPKNCIYMRWNYAAPQALGSIKAMDWFSKNGLQVMGATAAQRRWTLMPQNGGNMEPIKTFAQISRDKGLDGLLLTTWDDDSPHSELYNRGILAFAEYSWSGEKRTRSELLSAYRQREFSYTLSDSEFAFIDRLEKPVGFWNNALLKNYNRRHLKRSTRPDTILVGFPDSKNKGSWSKRNQEKLVEAKAYLATSDSISKIIHTMQDKALRNKYTLEVYEQVNHLAGYTPKLLLALEKYDLAPNEEKQVEALMDIKELRSGFPELRKNLEKVYAEVRILNKPDDYILDQDHKNHLPNLTKNFDWQFNVELLFMEMMDRELANLPYLENADPLKK